MSRAYGKVVQEVDRTWAGNYWGPGK